MLIQRNNECVLTVNQIGSGLDFHKGEEDATTSGLSQAENGEVVTICRLSEQYVDRDSVAGSSSSYLVKLGEVIHESKT